MTLIDRLNNVFDTIKDLGREKGSEEYLLFAPDVWEHFRKQMIKCIVEQLEKEKHNETNQSS